jgi:protein gp37
MSNNTLIEWATMSWPVTTGCTYAGKSCLNCYAVRDSWRLASNPNPKVSAPYLGLVKKVQIAGLQLLRWTNRVKYHQDRLDWITQQQKPRRVFVGNMGDLFHRDVPDWFIDLVFERMELCRQHKFLVLTKRAQRLAKYVSKRRPSGNVMLGISAGTKQELASRGSEMLRIKGWQKFLSLEPLIEDISRELSALLQHPDSDFVWVVCGGESDKKQSGARTCELEWLASIVSVCQESRVQVFVKQLGGYLAGSLQLKDRKGCDWDEWNGELAKLKIREYEP